MITFSSPLGPRIPWLLQRELPVPAPALPFPKMFFQETQGPGDASGGRGAELLLAGPVRSPPRPSRHPSLASKGTLTPLPGPSEKRPETAQAQVPSAADSRSVVCREELELIRLSIIFAPSAEFTDLRPLAPPGIPGTQGGTSGNSAAGALRRRTCGSVRRHFWWSRLREGTPGIRRVEARMSLHILRHTGQSPSHRTIAPTWSGEPGSKSPLRAKPGPAALLRVDASGFSHLRSVLQLAQ